MTLGYLSEAFVSFQGEGLDVGRRHLFLRFAGCPLRCRYCDTPESLVRTPVFEVHGGEERQQSNPVSLRSLLESVRFLLARGPVDGTSLTGGEPLAQSRFITQLLRESVVPRPVLLETSGTLPDRLAEVIDAVDVVSMDLKLPSNTGESEFWAVHEEFLRIAAGRVYVKVLVDDETQLDEVGRAARLVEEVAPSTPVFLQPITSSAGRVAISPAALEAAYAALRAETSDVRVLPQTHRFLAIR